MRELSDILSGPLDVPAVMMAIGNVAFIFVLIRWHVSDGPFDFRKALLDPATGSISFSRLGQLVALVSSTEWGFYEVVNGRMTQWYLLAYLGAWAGVAVYSKWQDSQNAKGNVQLPKHDEDVRP